MADGNFLRLHLFTKDESKFAGNTHHYWIRWGLTSDPEAVIKNFVPSNLPIQIKRWLKIKLSLNIFNRLPSEYSTLIKTPFSVSLGKVAEERNKRTEWIIEHRLPTIIPYAIMHLEINRLLRSIGAPRPPLNENEFSVLFSNLSKSAIQKARKLFPEVWDEQRGHYILDSRGAQFAQDLVAELNQRNLLSATTRFIDIGSGVGTNVFAINHYSAASATGVEIHRGMIKLTNATMRRLARLGEIDVRRLNFLAGDAFDSKITNLKQFDVFYVYSPIGKLEIDIDDIVDVAQPGALIIFNRLPIRNRELVKQLENVAGLYAFRKTATASGA
ncbi:MAG: class I SAM-dependent methyltransferase [Mariniblastus sp.]|nr:class I SAM-dependent methyltransferase [Mariniblastus sp.]